jgi:hypothetical protein
MQELEVTWDRIVPICWLIVWRLFVGSIFIGTILLILIAPIFETIFPGASLRFYALALTAARFVSAIIVLVVWWPLVVRMAVRKRYQGSGLS